MRTVWVLATIALGLTPAAARQVPDVRTPPAGGGFEAQHRKKLWVTYRSFNRELERTGQFGAMGIMNRCFLRERAARVTDLLTGETVANDVHSFETDFHAPDTRLFKIEGK